MARESDMDATFRDSIFAIMAGKDADQNLAWRKVPIIQGWGGEISLALRKEAPPRRYIASEEAWERLWSSWRDTEECPKIDFTQELIVVVANQDPNRLSLLPVLHDTGELRIFGFSTQVFYGSAHKCTYQILRIKRAGIKTINGKPIQTE